MMYYFVLVLLYSVLILCGFAPISFVSASPQSESIDKNDLAPLKYFLLLEQKSLWGIDDKFSMKFSPLFVGSNAEKIKDLLSYQLSDNPSNETRKIVNSIISNATNGNKCDKTLESEENGKLRAICSRSDNEVMIQISSINEPDYHVIFLDNSISIDNATNLTTAVVGPPFPR